MPTIFRRRLWTRRSSRHYWVPYSAGVVTETITVDPFSITLTPQNVLENEGTPITHQSIVFTGQSVTEVENELVGNFAITFTGQTVLENDGTPIDSGDITFTGGTVNLIDSEATLVDPATITLTGGTVTDTDFDTIPITHFTVSLSFQDVGSVEFAPQGGVMAGGGGGDSSGPAPDDVYYGTQKRQQEKRDEESRLWTGKPARPVPDSEKSEPAKPAEVKKTITTTPEPEGPDLDALIADLMVPMINFVPPPRPQRVFDPEDDLDVILLNEF